MPETGIISECKSGVVVFEWMINDFFTLSEIDGAEYWSPYFYFGNVKWYLRIYPNGWRGRDSLGHVDLHLCKDYFSRSIKQSFSLSIKTACGEKYKKQYSMKDFRNGYDCYQFIRFIPRWELTNRKPELVPEGVLTVVCTMKISTSAGTDSKSVYAD